jgi:hypothetical protein
MRLAHVRDQELPRLQFVENFEKERPEEYVFGSRVGAGYHAGDQILAHAVRCAIRVRKPILREDWITCEGYVTGETTEVHSLTLSREVPVRVEDLGRFR